MKKITCFMLALITACAMIACGDTGGENSAPESKADVESAAAGELSSEETEEEPSEAESFDKSESSEEASDETSAEASEDTSDGGDEMSENTSSEFHAEQPAKEYVDGKKLVVFGDSITALGSWGRTAADRLNMYFFNGAMGGITSEQGIARFPAYAAGRGADFITLLFGMNDLIMVSSGNPRVTPEQFGENLKTLVRMARDDGAEPILLTSNPLDPNKFWSAQGQSKAMYESVGGDPLAWLEVYNDVTRRVAVDRYVQSLRGSGI